MYERGDVVLFENKTDAGAAPVEIIERISASHLWGEGGYWVCTADGIECSVPDSAHISPLLVRARFDTREVW